MKTHLMTFILTGIALSVVASAPAYAGGVIISPVIGIAPAPVYAPPPPVYVSPAPVYVAPYPAYYDPYHYHRDWRYWQGRPYPYYR